ncbi:MAG: hypothetical protein RLZZ241_1132 [Bacteroidota bacterium]|jgi:hypothetical protein
MKQIKLLTLAFTALLFASACSEDDSVGMEVKAPSNVQVILDVAQDNSGSVTVTPSADGASSFQILFGDVDGETPTNVSAGASTTHTYAEGTYTLTVIAVGPTGLTAQITQTVNISFAAPSNLSVEIAISETNPYAIEVTPSADNATTFDVYYGEAEDEEPASVNVGGTGEYEYSAAGTYSIRVVAMGAGAATAEVTEAIEIIGAVQPVVFPITFDDLLVNYQFTGFGGVDPAIVIENPDASGSNTTARVAQLSKTAGAETWAGATIDLGEPIDFSAGTTVKMQVWSPRAGTNILFKVENLDDPNINAEASSSTTVAEGWEELTFDLTGLVNLSNTYGRVALFPDFGNAGQGEDFYFDEISLVSAPTELPQLPVDFETPNVSYNLEVFGGVDPAIVVANPDQSGINTSAKVAQLTKTAGAETWGGATMLLDGPIDFSAGTNVKIKVWSPRAGTTILFKVENADDAGINAEASSSTTVAGAWEELSFDLTGLVNLGNSYGRIALFPDFGNAGQGEDFFFDDIALAASEAVLPELPADFESSTISYNWIGFGSVDFSEIPSGVVPNPDATGINTSDFVVQISKTAGAQVWAGSTMTLAGPIDFSAGTTIKMKVWSPRTNTPILFKLENASDAGIFAEVTATTTTASGWEELSFDFNGSINPANTYGKIAIFPDFGSLGAGEDFYFDDIALASSESQLPQLPVGFESANTTYNLIGFGGVSFAGVIDNPDATGINTSGKVVQITKGAGAEVWAGATMLLAGPIDFSSSTVVTIKVWSPRAGTPILFKIENADDAAINAEVQAVTTVAAGWETLSFDMSTSAVGVFNSANSYGRIALFPDFGATGQGESFYFDDITLN